MHAGFIPWWKRARMAHSEHHAEHAEHGHGEGHGCGSGHGFRGGWHSHGDGPRGFSGGFEDGGSSFGVRRPLRFLAFKLDLDEGQVAELAKILDALKTERAQASVDDRRAVAAFADAAGGATFDLEKAAEAAKGRVGTAERLGQAVVSALGKIHALLAPEQRERLAYLVRTGTLTL